MKEQRGFAFGCAAHHKSNRRLWLPRDPIPFPVSPHFELRGPSCSQSHKFCPSPPARLPARLLRLLSYSGGRLRACSAHCRLIVVCTYSPSPQQQQQQDSLHFTRNGGRCDELWHGAQAEHQLEVGLLRRCRGEPERSRAQGRQCGLRRARRRLR